MNTGVLQRAILGKEINVLGKKVPQANMFGKMQYDRSFFLRFTMHADPREPLSMHAVATCGCFNLPSCKPENKIFLKKKKNYCPFNNILLNSLESADIGPKVQKNLLVGRQNLTTCIQSMASPDRKACFRNAGLFSMS